MVFTGSKVSIGMHAWWESFRRLHNTQAMREIYLGKLEKWSLKERLRFCCWLVYWSEKMDL